MFPADLRVCLDAAIEAAVAAGRAIMDVYAATAYGVELKSDNSPLTEADRAAHSVIMRFLEQTPYAVLSEEGRSIPYTERRGWNPLWIVDPLDGTKEFIKRNGEFTVNIALIHDHAPVCGVVFAPVARELFFAAAGVGSFRVDNPSSTVHGELCLTGSRLPMARRNDDALIIMGSRSHPSPEFAAFVEKVRKERGKADVVPAGSSLKICRVAEGSADMYPRLGPTMEWDTAAGHAIAKFAGKRITAWKTGEELRYNKEDLLNPWFLVQ